MIFSCKKSSRKQNIFYSEVLSLIFIPAITPSHHLLSLIFLSQFSKPKESQRRQEGFGSVRDRRTARGSQRDIQDSGGSRSSHGRSRHGASTGSLKLKKDLLSKSVDYSDMDTVREGGKGVTRKQRSKSIDHLNQSQVIIDHLNQSQVIV